MVNEYSRQWFEVFLDTVPAEWTGRTSRASGVGFPCLGADGSSTSVAGPAGMPGIWWPPATR